MIEGGKCFFEKKQNEVIDDFFSKGEVEEKKYIHSGKYPDGKEFSVYLTPQEIDDCIKSKGSIETIRKTIDQLAQWPDRKHEIKEWGKSIRAWKFKNNISSLREENEKTGKEIHEKYSQRSGWSARFHRNTLKDDVGILFESSSVVGNPIPVFISFSDAKFYEKCEETLKSKKMKTI